MPLSRPSTFLAAGTLLLVAACATGGIAHVDEARLATLSPYERQQVKDQERELDVARSNAEIATVAERDVEQWRAAVKSELAAAMDGVAAAQKSVARARRRARRDPTRLEEAERESVRAAERLEAVNAKLQYVRDLVALRQSEVELRESELRAARASVELNRFDHLAARSQPADLDRSDFVSNRDEARDKVNQVRTAVDVRRRTVRATRGAWSDRRGSIGATTRDSLPPPQPID